MKKLLILALMFSAFSSFAQKTATKKEVVTIGNTIEVSQVPKSKEEIIAKWVNTGKVYAYEGSSYDVYMTSTGKSFYIVLKTAEGWAKKKIN